MCPKKVPGEMLSIENTKPSVCRARRDDRRKYCTHHSSTCRRQPPDRSGVLLSSDSLVVACLIEFRGKLRCPRGRRELKCPGGTFIISQIPVSDKALLAKFKTRRPTNILLYYRLISTWYVAPSQQLTQTDMASCRLCVSPYPPGQQRSLSSEATTKARFNRE